ncbi:MAG: helix-turn-helix transcriptional regulator [Bacteroidota bacterium]|nr:helix-turn-helix transcriptional regulator [Bacteroidota bacterium]
MPIVIELDKILAERGMRSNELAQAIGITTANLSILKTGKAKAIRFSTLEAICKVLDFKPGDIFKFHS